MNKWDNLNVPTLCRKLENDFFFFLSFQRLISSQLWMGCAHKTLIIFPHPFS